MSTDLLKSNQAISLKLATSPTLLWQGQSSSYGNPISILHPNLCGNSATNQYDSHDINCANGNLIYALFNTRGKVPTSNKLIIDSPDKHSATVQ